MNGRCEKYHQGITGIKPTLYLPESHKAPRKEREGIQCPQNRHGTLEDQK